MLLPGRNRTSRLTFLGFMLAVALILSYVETLIPLSFSVPGIKLGLANLCVLILLYNFGTREAILVNVLRIILAGFMFGNLSMIMYSGAGALFSILFMLLAKKFNRFSVCGVSIIGGVFHNVGQIIVAGLVVSSVYVFTYLPFLLIAGAVTGFVLGIVANILIPIINRSNILRDE